MATIDYDSWFIKVRSLAQSAHVYLPPKKQLEEWYENGCDPHDVIDNIKGEIHEDRQ